MVKLSLSWSRESEENPGKTKEKKLWVLLFKMLFVYLLCRFVFKLALMWAPANSLVLLYCEIVRVTVMAADIVILFCFSDSLTSSFLYSLFLILGCYLIDVLMALIWIHFFSDPTALIVMMNGLHMLSIWKTCAYFSHPVKPDIEIGYQIKFV